MGHPGMCAGPREARVTLGALNLPLLLAGNVLLSCLWELGVGEPSGLWGRGGRISDVQDK